MVSIGVFSGCKELFHPESAENGNENGNGHNGGYTLSEPTGVTATAQSSDSIQVSWNEVSGAEYYKVCRSTYDVGYSTINTIGYGYTFYTDTGLSEHTTYYYKVIAANGLTDSEMSSSASAATYSGNSSDSTPSTPTNVTATAQSSSSIQVSWGAPSSGTVDEYYVYRASSYNGPYNHRLSSSSTIPQRHIRTRG
ncbi:MAG: fibronectin type III domain-containing protein [Treponema sp.]|nr:fibronectin type III domain-containing protein [Treponema sp.]